MPGTSPGTTNSDEVQSFKRKRCRFEPAALCCMDQARRVLKPVAPEWMSGPIENPGARGFKIN